MTTPIAYAKPIRLPLGIPAPKVTFLECHFEFAPPEGRADVHACLFCDKPMLGWRAYPGSTRLIDLQLELDSIFAGFSKDTRYEINRAKRDGVVASVYSMPTRVELEEFMDYYDAFAASKGVSEINRAQLRAWHAAEKVALSVARNAAGTELASHAYILDQPRARLTHSASLFRLEHDSSDRSEIGRANRLLHWTGLNVFREMGARWYDFGGWYEGSVDQALLRINAFKAEFGGEIIKEWSSFRSGSPLGSLYLIFRDLMLRKKS